RFLTFRGGGVTEGAEAVNPNAGARGYFFEVVGALKGKGLITSPFFNHPRKELPPKEPANQSPQAFWFDDDRSVRSHLFASGTLRSSPGLISPRGLSSSGSSWTGSRAGGGLRIGSMTSWGGTTAASSSWRPRPGWGSRRPWPIWRSRA